MAKIQTLKVNNVTVNVPVRVLETIGKVLTTQNPGASGIMDTLTAEGQTVANQFVSAIESNGNPADIFTLNIDGIDSYESPRYKLVAKMRIALTVGEWQSTCLVETESKAQPKEKGSLSDFTI